MIRNLEKILHKNSGGISIQVQENFRFVMHHIGIVFKLVFWLVNVSRHIEEEDSKDDFWKFSVFFLLLCPAYRIVTACGENLVDREDYPSKKSHFSELTDIVLPCPWLNSAPNLLLCLLISLTYCLSAADGTHRGSEQWRFISGLRGNVRITFEAKLLIFARYYALLVFLSVKELYIVPLIGQIKNDMWTNPSERQKV